MLFSDITLIDENFASQEHQWIGTIDGRIAYVGDAEPENPARFGEVYPGHDRVLMPGLYNAHSHAPMTLLRGYAENLPLQTWLFERIFPFEDKMTAEDCYWATKLACAEMLRYGTVSFSDMYYHSRDCVRAVRETGMKCNMSDTLIAPQEKSYDEYPLAAANRAYLEELQGADDGRILIDFNVHAEYTTNPLSVRTLAEAAKEAGVRVQVHVSETRSEHEECKERHGGLTRNVAGGLLRQPGAVRRARDGSPLRMDRGRGLRHLGRPWRNRRGKSGIEHEACKRIRAHSAHARARHQRGAWHGRLRIEQQSRHVPGPLRACAASDPTFISPAQALRIATRNGALSQGREDCGLVREGMRADLVVLDASGPSWHPAGDAASHAVYAGHGADVVLTMVDGRVLYRDGNWTTVDVEEAKAHVEAAKQRILQEL